MSRLKIETVRVLILDPNGEMANFHMLFYGVPLQEFMISPGGGERIRLALERRGLFGYMSSPFLCSRVYNHGNDSLH